MLNTKLNILIKVILNNLHIPFVIFFCKLEKPKHIQYTLNTILLEQMAKNLNYS